MTGAEKEMYRIYNSFTGILTIICYIIVYAKNNFQRILKFVHCNEPLVRAMIKYTKRLYFTPIIISTEDYKKIGWFYYSEKGGPAFHAGCYSYKYSGSDNYVLSKVLSTTRKRSVVLYHLISYHALYDILGLVRRVLKPVKVLHRSFVSPCIL